MKWTTVNLQRIRCFPESPMAIKNRQPTFPRYERVESILNTEEALVARLSPADQPVMRPDGKSRNFSREVVEITERLHNSGKDVHKMPQKDIIKVACQVVDLNSKPRTTAVENGAPAAPLAPASKPARQRKAKTKPATAKEKPVEKPAGRPSKKVLKPAAAAAKVAASKSSAAPVAPSNGPSSAGPLALTEQSDVWNLYSACYSNQTACIQLCEAHDKLPGAQARVDRMNELAQEFCGLARTVNRAQVKG